MAVAPCFVLPAASLAMFWQMACLNGFNFRAMQNMDKLQELTGRAGPLSCMCGMMPLSWAAGQIYVLNYTHGTAMPTFACMHNDSQQVL